MKIRPFAADLFHVDGQTDIPNLIVAIRSFANAPKDSQKVRILVEESPSFDSLLS